MFTETAIPKSIRYNQRSNHMKALVTLGMGILTATILSHTATAGAITLLQDDFTGASLDTAKWNVYTSNTANTVKLTGSGELEIDLNYEHAYDKDGIISKQAFAIPTGQTLIVDWYGTNSWDWYGNAYNSQSCRPLWRVSTPAGNKYTEITGASNYDNDNPSVTGYPKATYGAYKHCIITIDAVNIHYYIANNAYTSSLTPISTVATNTIFNSSDLAAGLVVQLKAFRVQNWAGVGNYERFDGIQVSIPEPASLALLALGGLVLPRRRR